MTPSWTPAASHAAIARSQSASVAASGFSTMTWAPFAAAASIASACTGCGVHTETAWTPASRTIVATSVNAATP